MNHLNRLLKFNCGRQYRIKSILRRGSLHIVEINTFPSEFVKSFLRDLFGAQTTIIW